MSFRVGSALPARTAGSGDASIRPGSAVRVIKRYANRKLYDTETKRLTSLRRIEQLIRTGVDIRVADHDTGKDMTSEVLVGVLGSSIGEREEGHGVEALTSLIRSPAELLEAMAQDERWAEELGGMQNFDRSRAGAAAPEKHPRVR